MSEPLYQFQSQLKIKSYSAQIGLQITLYFVSWILRLLLSSCLFYSRKKIYKYSNNNDNKRYQIFLAKQGKRKGGGANLRIHETKYNEYFSGGRRPNASLHYTSEWILRLAHPPFPFPCFARN